MNIKIYKVGGAVRDEILGLKTNDIDYCMECSYNDMRNWILSQNGVIFIEKPEFGVIRCRIGNEAADYTIARIDGNYSDGRRPDNVEMGTILDDLSRRDFTMNAIAIDETGNYIDPHNGIQDIKDKVIRCVGKTDDRMGEDGLRIVRAIRFAVTKEMNLSGEIIRFLYDKDNYKLLKNVAPDRIREELNKMFAYSSSRTLYYMRDYQLLFHWIFDNTNISLMATQKEK